ncbi:MAG: HAMP domain-containing protein [Betaproteobacteria bacterium]|nr:MAG: HAMP domain-containing protein [Betaproteobacteria bacterium]
MMRLLPRSLFGRLVVVLLGGLVLAQLATAYLNFAERGELLYRAGGMRLAQQISDIVKLLDSLPPPERRRVVAVFNAPPLAVSLDRAPLREEAVAGDSDFPRSMFATLLRYALGDEAKILIARAPAARDALFAGERPAPPHMPMMQHPRWSPGGFAGGASFIVQIALRDGSWATFDSQLSPQAAAVPWRVGLTLLVLLGTVIVLSLIAVRWVTGPLSVLAKAAEGLGENIHHPPLAETGPAEVQRAARAFNTMQQRLARFISDRTRILTAMSHDLKTPITRMRLRAEALDDEALRGKFVRDLEAMESMVTQTLEFMRDTSAAEAVQRIDVMALLESLRSDYADMGKAVTIEGSSPQPLPGRPLALRRCLGNLLDNANRYGGRATIRVEDNAREIVIRVLDEGPGMTPQELEKAFEPFFRGEASRSRETGGTGLGLGIARNIARAHGGELLLHNRSPNGLEAILTLPRSQAR